MEGPFRIATLPETQESKPFRTDGDVFLLIAIDDVKNSRAFGVTRIPHLLLQGRCHVETACFQNQRHNGKTCEQIVARIMSGLPKAVMCGKGSIMRTQGCQAVSYQIEMFRLLKSHLHPAIEKRPRNRFADESGNDVESQIHRIEFDMSYGVQ